MHSSGSVYENEGQHKLIHSSNKNNKLLSFIGQDKSLIIGNVIMHKWRNQLNMHMSNPIMKVSKYVQC